MNRTEYEAFVADCHAAWAKAGQPPLRFRTYEEHAAFLAACPTPESDWIGYANEVER